MELVEEKNDLTAPISYGVLSELAPQLYSSNIACSQRRCDEIVSWVAQLVRVSIFYFLYIIFQGVWSGILFSQQPIIVDKVES